MRETWESRIENATTLQDAIFLLKEKTKMDTHVATLAYVEKIKVEKNATNKFGLVECKPFPLNPNQEEYTIQAYYFKEESEFEKGDIILVLFTDLNFVNNLKSIETSPKETYDLNYHSLKYGIIIDTM